MSFIDVKKLCCNEAMDIEQEQFSKNSKWHFVLTILQTIYLTV